MTNNFIILLIVIPLGTGILSLLLIDRLRLARLVGTLSLMSTAAISIYLLTQLYHDGAIFTSQMGDWPAPFGISVVFDSLSGLLLAAASVVALGSYVHSYSTMSDALERRYYHPLMQFLMFGVNLSFLTGDLFNLFVAFEIMLMASYALLTLGASRRQMSQAYKYVMLNLIASALFVISAGIVYGLMGTLNFADLARIVAEHKASGEPLPLGFRAVSLMFLFVFGLKGAIFPLWFWLPDTYYTTPISIAGLFAGMLTKVGIYATLRTFPMIFAQMEAGQLVMPIIAVSAAFTMFLGVLGAVSMHEVRRILAIHVISQVGYMVFGIAVMSAAAMAGCLFYMIQHMVVKCALFLCCGIMERYAGSDDLNKIGGVLKRDWLLGLLFFIAAMSLVGLPPLSGFFGKMVIIAEGWNGFWVLSMFGLLTGALTLLSMLKIWGYGYWGPPQGDHAEVPVGARRVRRYRSGYVGIGILVVTALFLGFGANPVYKIAFTAGDQLFNTYDYRVAVLGEDFAGPNIGPMRWWELPEVMSAEAPGDDASSLDSASVGSDALADGNSTDDHVTAPVEWPDFEGESHAAVDSNTPDTH
ncbi:MAG: proton-conducting transporter membrane subunit [Planctomycetota bacterium]